MLGTKTPEEAFQDLNNAILQESKSPLQHEKLPCNAWRKNNNNWLSTYIVNHSAWDYSLVASETERFGTAGGTGGNGDGYPVVIGFIAFTAVPMIISLLLVMTKWSGISTLDQAQWVGLANFIHMFKYDVKFWQSLW